MLRKFRVSIINLSIIWFVLTSLFNFHFLALGVHEFVSASLCHAEESRTIQNVGSHREENQKAIDLPPEIPPLPGPTEASNRFFVSKRNVSLFHELLLAPIAAWIREGSLIIKVARELNFPLRLSFNGNIKSDSKHFDLDNQFNLIAVGGENSLLRNHLPFEVQGDINDELDNTRKAYKILWNGYYTQIATLDLLSELEINWVGLQSVVLQSSAIFFQREPSELYFGRKTQGAVSSQNEILRQEVLQFSTPPVIYGLTQITWRYLGPREDDVWIYSPVIGESRKVFEANRSDPLIGGVLTLDDLFVWSGKAQSANAKIVGEKVLLLPFSSLNLYQSQIETDSQLSRDVISAKGLQGRDTTDEKNSKGITAQGDSNPSTLNFAQSKENKITKDNQGKLEAEVWTVRGNFQSSNASSSMVTWNYDTRELPEAAPWVPTSVIFVPRQVWILELTPRDPFYLGGRQIIVVDKESFLPFYKLEYSRRGDYKKTIVGSWAIAVSPDKKIHFPFSSFVITVDQSSRRVNLVTPRSVSTFSGKDSIISSELRKLLLISSFGMKSAGTTPSIAVDTKNETRY